jgi:hypothetical protein
LHYKLDAGDPMSRITFKEFDLSPSISDSTFAFAAPEGYRRIRVVGRRDTGTETAASNDAGRPTMPGPRRMRGGNSDGEKQ